MANALAPDRGQVTFDSEGQEGGKYHSRVLHVPGDSSGLTIGRGYDMRSKLAATIVSDLTAAGVSLEDAKTLSAAAGLSGADAKKYIADHKLENFEISELAQKTLFASTYKAEAGEAKRIAQKSDVTTKYGACDWDKLDPAIQDIVVDLKYRGDYTGTSRAFLQKAIVDNDLEAFAKAVNNPANWSNVPKDRFDRRKAFLDAAVAEKKKQDALKPKPPIK
jgi:hypothetical protein